MNFSLKKKKKYNLINAFGQTGVQKFQIKIKKKNYYFIKLNF